MVHFILACTQCLQHLGRGHSQVWAALTQLLQSGLEPDGLLARFFPCEADYYQLNTQGPRHIWAGDFAPGMCRFFAWASW